MANASTRAVSGVFGLGLRAALMAAASSVLFAPVAFAAPDCAVGTSGDDVCIITLNNAGNENVDAGANTATGDKLQFGDDPAAAGLQDFSFDVGRIGADPGLRNFELFEKIDAVTVTLTGSATAQTHWNVLAGTLLATGSASGSGSIFDTSTITVASGATFGIIGAGGNNETIGNLNGVAGSFVTLGGTGTLITGGNSTTTTFAGVMSGTGNFTKAGSGVMILSGDNDYSGTTNVVGGILEIGHAGAIDASTQVTTGVGGRLTGTTAYTINGAVTNAGQITGNVTVNGNLISNGGLLPGNSSIPPEGGTVTNPGQDMGTITINGNYATSGANAYFGMFVDLDAGTEDFVNINGNVSGTDPTYLYMIEFDTAAEAGFATTGDGIQVIRVSGATTAGAFRQGTSLTAGPYQYLLRYVADYAGGGGADGYFLQSTARDEIVAHPALLTAGQNLIRNCFRDDQRIPDSPKGASYGRAWFGYRQGNTSFGADTGVEMDQDFSCTSGGMDWRLGHGWFGGVSGGFGSTKSDVAAPAGIGTLDGDARVIEAYASFTSSSLFVNLSAGYNDMDWLYDGALITGATAASSGFIASAQAGVALGVEAVAIKLIGAVNYDGTNCGDSCFGFAATEDTGIIDAKGTIRFDGVSWGGSVRPWAAVSYSDVLSDGINTVSAGPFTISSESLNQLLSLDAGLQTYLDENLSLYLDGGYHESLGKEVSGYKAGIGMKLYW